ncbi:DegT/DnrJ/EryC1/StrS family aminotransferase [bacterium]|nr:DegT/DnrJ/EryC1/StrS family aminotransferase [bacterium]
MRKIPYARIVCDGNEQKYIREVLDSGWLTTAGKSHEFERLFSESVGVKHAVSVNSCTAAMHLALEAIGIKPGDKVFVPTMTFTATAEVIRYMGADPVFLDVDYGTSLITPELLKEAVSAHAEVKTLVLVHYGGQAAEMLGENGILSICRQHAIRVIEDAAHAFPSREGGRMVGGLGKATCFSFYANKTITTGEGGMLCTDDEGLAERARIMRLHGINRDIWSRYLGTRSDWAYDVVAPGFKYNMPDLNAAVGLAQLERAEEYRTGRQRCAEYYFRELARIPCIDLPVLRVNPEDHAWHLFPVVLKPDAPVARDSFMERMSENGIGTSVHYKPLHRMTYYRERYGLKPENYPGAEKRWQGCVSLPIYPSLTKGELGYVCSVIRNLLA